jgi:hypothetical protein
MTYRYAPLLGLRVLQVVVLVEAIARGLAYILTPHTVLGRTDIVNSAPIEVWGTIFIIFGLAGLLGEVLMSGYSPASGIGANPRAWPSFLAHSGLMIMYFTLSLAYLEAAVDGDPSLSSSPAAMLVFAYVHWLFARRRGSHVT